MSVVVTTAIPPEFFSPPLVSLMANMASKIDVRGFVSYPCPFFTPKNKAKVVKRAFDEHPEYEFAWVKTLDRGWLYSSISEAKPTVVRKRKNVIWAEAHKVNFDGEGMFANGEEFRPCIVSNGQGLHDVVDYAENYFISKSGVVAVRDNDNGCSAYKPYRHNGDYYCVDLMNKGEHTNQTIRGLLANSWGDEVANEFIAREETGEELFAW